MSTGLLYCQFQCQCSFTASNYCSCRLNILFWFYWLGPMKSMPSDQLLHLNCTLLGLCLFLFLAFRIEKLLLLLFYTIYSLYNWDFSFQSMLLILLLLEFNLRFFLGRPSIFQDLFQSWADETLQLLERYRILSTRLLQSILFFLFCLQVHQLNILLMSLSDRVFNDFSGLNFLLQRYLKLGICFDIQSSISGYRFQHTNCLVQQAFIKMKMSIF